jgi:proteasome accessory factor PafA2
VATAKICGIETEYGIVLRGTDDPNPIAASSILINAYLADLTREGGSAHGVPKIGWDFEDEQPGMDARGFAPSGAMPPEVETHLVNAVLTNGARYYVDHAHPELSTPECADARSVVVFDRAAERILERSMRAADAILPPGQSIVVYKNNSDGKGNSYGCHENYLMDRQVPFGRIVADITPHFVTRQIFCGAGKVGCEAGLGPDRVPYQISQRADFFEEEVGLETTLKRPIVNTRDEPHADPQKYRRLHVIIGDANMSEVATLLKVGTTSIVLAMIEDDWLPRSFAFASPVTAVRQVSYDLSLREPITLVDGTTITALAVQWELLSRARSWADANGLDAVGLEVGSMVLDRWEHVLAGLESDPSSLAAEVDWIAKHRLIDGYRKRHELQWGDARLHALDLQYHDLRPDRSLAARVGLETICTDVEIDAAMSEPPLDTRAYFRGACLAKFGEDIVSANWDSLVFDIGTDPLRRVPMMEPSRGTAAHVASVIESSRTSAELLERLGS